MRLKIITAVLMAVVAPSVWGASMAQAKCANVNLSHNQVLVVSVSKVSCGEGRAVAHDFYSKKRPKARCYRVHSSECRNGMPTDLANSYWIIRHGWKCATGAGGGGCLRGSSRINFSFQTEEEREAEANEQQEAEENSGV